MYNIFVLPGDGIGIEVTQSAVRVLKALDLDIKFSYGEIGYECYKRHKTPLPDKTIDQARTCDAVLFGAVTTPPNIENYFSPIVKLRQDLQLYANIRPNKSYPIPGFRENVDLVIVRENTEGLYSGVERTEQSGEKAITERIITNNGCERIIRYAYEMAKKQNRKKLTYVHKANILRQTCGLFRSIAQEISQEYPNITTEEMLVDAMAMQLINKPESFDVIVTTNLFGDILSDEACMLVGGLGLAASANIGKAGALFEPVHGSAPDISGKNIANPFAAIMSAKMMLDYLGEENKAIIIEKSVVSNLKKGYSTKDLGGNLNINQVTDKVIEKIQELIK
ncbi:MAG: Homoisocitrate dehydrogenase [Candidatus Woesearchaeota archaeon]|nr:Homoisocitrate dehydrogenase [Candidatus Woesearchaeota archaeon]